MGEDDGSFHENGDFEVGRVLGGNCQGQNTFRAASCLDAICIVFAKPIEGDEDQV